MKHQSFVDNGTLSAEDALHATLLDAEELQSVITLYDKAGDALKAQGHEHEEDLHPVIGTAVKRKFLNLSILDYPTGIDEQLYFNSPDPDYEEIALQWNDDNLPRLDVQYLRHKTLIRDYNHITPEVAYFGTRLTAAELVGVLQQYIADEPKLTLDLGLKASTLDVVVMAVVKRKTLGLSLFGVLDPVDQEMFLNAEAPEYAAIAKEWKTENPLTPYVHVDKAQETQEDQKSLNGERVLQGKLVLEHGLELPAAVLSGEGVTPGLGTIEKAVVLQFAGAVSELLTYAKGAGPANGEHAALSCRNLMNQFEDCLTKLHIAEHTA